jgi:hypothetical protein
MSKRELRWFTLVSFLLGMVGIVVAIMVNAAHIDLVFGSIYLVSFIGSMAGLLAVLLFLTAWILAIIKLGQLRQWTWFTLLLVTLVVFFPLGAVLLLLYLFVWLDDRPAQPAPPEQSPAYSPYYPPYAPALPAQSSEQSLYYPSPAPAPLPHAASERQLQ